MSPRHISAALLDDDEDFPMVGVAAPDLNFGVDHPPETLLQQLVRHWLNERHAPDILPVQAEVLGALLDHIRRQTDTVQALRGDPDTSEAEHARIMLVQTEVERVKFVVRSYIRTRLYKALQIEKFARYIVATSEVQEKLSQAELDHARRFAQLTENHFQASVLQSLPPHQQGLEDNTPFTPPMISGPDKSRAVFVHARDECPPVRLPDGTTMQMQKGQIVLTPYAVVEQLLAMGSVELI
ncbi:GINS complex Sld5 component [Multifurca ochricompacta]|uniref:DNA replication complex GINS protein SLD5 n=1 Tax=Multifurca ochricompacta TaxID=376703 RepID=A0AAD4QKV5_9AGAM|nr:GINS complex Sld5 component [Multifurca ochricompacta]